MSHPPNVESISLTRKEFDRLPEYSCSFPTGITIGKRWKRNLSFTDPRADPDVWYMGEYVGVDKKGYTGIGIHWRQIYVEDSSVLPMQTLLDEFMQSLGDCPIPAQGTPFYALSPQDIETCARGLIERVWEEMTGKSAREMGASL